MVQITPQKPKLILPTWSWPLWLSLALFFLSVGAFVFLKVYISQIQADIIVINDQIKTEAGKVNADDENTVIRLSDSFAAFSNIVSDHSYFSNFFDLIGSLAYSKAVFIKIDADRDKGVVQIKGIAQNYTALAKQMVALRNSPDVKNLEVKGINFGTTGLDFELTLGVDREIFTKK